MLVCLSCMASAQNGDVQRNFPVPPKEIEAAVARLPGGTSGRLPLVDGFVANKGIALDRYQRAFYQCTVEVVPQGSGSLVRVVAKISAWNSDPAHLGYEKLQSNGRIEADLLDRLQDAIAGQNPVMSPKNGSVKPQAAANAQSVPQISAPVRQLPSIRELSKTATNSAPSNPALEEEVRSVQDLLRNQSHPSNLVAIHRDETPVLQSARTDATVLFLASAQDEFEILSVSSDWVYVRISGLSRGWIRKSDLEFLDSPSPENQSPSSATAVPIPGDHAPQIKSEIFSISTEVSGNFPGEWEPLKGKSVRIISVQPTDVARASTPEEKLRFAESIFSAQAEKPTPSTEGLVVIFDSDDGGMVAATGRSMKAWGSGAISGQAFWNTCYFDPPGILGQQ